MKSHRSRGQHSVGFLGQVTASQLPTHKGSAVTRPFPVWVHPSTPVGKAQAEGVRSSSPVRAFCHPAEPGPFPLQVRPRMRMFFVLGCFGFVCLDFFVFMHQSST